MHGNRVQAPGVGFLVLVRGSRGSLAAGLAPKNGTTTVALGKQTRNVEVHSCMASQNYLHNAFILNESTILESDK